MDDAKSLIRQAKQLRGAPVREDGVALAGEHGSKHPTCPTYRSMANRKRSMEEGLQIPGRDSVVDGPVTKPKFPQLLPRDNPVLLSRQRRNRVP